jgi:hypothetical protein
MALFVFGAGATRGASFVKDTLCPCLPPLDSDFFTQLQRVQNPKHKELINKVMEDVIDLFGFNFSVTMENVFTTLEHTIKMIEMTGDNREFKKNNLKKKRDRLLQAIVTVFEESLTKKDEQGHNKLEAIECEDHNKFVEKILKPQDDIISFNYDCLLDYSLKKFGNNKWNAQFGYSLKNGQRNKYLKGFEYWQPDQLATRKETVNYYKLHGSLNFRIDKIDSFTKIPIITLKERPYTKQSGNVKFEIIPPEWHKDYSKRLFVDLWKNSASAISRNRTIIFIGYSLPFTDLHSSTLFRTSIKKNNLNTIIVINPDKDSRHRTRNILQRGFHAKTKVLSFDYFSDFLKMERNTWDL